MVISSRFENGDKLIAQAYVLGKLGSIRWNLLSISCGGEDLHGYTTIPLSGDEMYQIQHMMNNHWRYVNNFSHLMFQLAFQQQKKRY